jgi:hypothetical protein
METQRDLAPTPEIARQALEAHVERLRQMVDRQRKSLEVGHGSPTDAAEAELGLAEAEYRLEHPTPPAGGPPQPAAEVTDFGGIGGGALGEPAPPPVVPRRAPDDPKTRAILAALEQPVAMAFENETPLGDVLKYIKQATTGDELPQGIPIYVDPQGLEVVDRTIDSPIRLSLEGVPLRQSLVLLLRQLDLAYDVKGGLLVISRPDLIAGVVQTGSAPGGDHPRSRAILAKLDQPTSMPFHDETPLEDLVKYIQSATQDDDLPQGIPVYVDPTGLQEAETTLQSPIQIQLEGVPLKRSLYLALRQLDLAYAIKDGILFISSPDGLDEILLASPIYETPELHRLQILNERGELTPEEEARFKKLEEEETARMKRQLDAQKGGMGGGLGAGGFQ